ncbi:hypothetical protein MR829_22945 [Paracoccus versutus]|uniref:hypothetical protein n=1 Tax=Paracoccus versutus TaxID=34007 RepID=UPI001FB7A349|nr:hypothetical protein [Paracoccus versutus]MCJ1903190.1 hypothetical protein [Paracoccus versutus]
MTRYLSAEAMSKDDFDVPFTKQTGEVIYDAKTKFGPWATMTEASYRTHGVGVLGIGFGQKYVRDEQGHLNLVEGGYDD